MSSSSSSCALELNSSKGNPWLEAEHIKQSIASFNPHSGGGPSGLRPAHVKEALTADQGDVVVNSMLCIVQKM